MGFATFQEIGAWQRAYELKLQIQAICQRPSFARDLSLRSQLIDAARSGPRNIAEGFARWNHGDFARFARIAKASEIELLNHFIEAVDSGHITVDERKKLDHAAKKAIKAVNGLIILRVLLTPRKYPNAAVVVHHKHHKHLCTLCTSTPGTQAPKAH